MREDTTSAPDDLLAQWLADEDARFAAMPKADRLNKLLAELRSATTELHKAVAEQDHDHIVTMTDVIEYLCDLIKTESAKPSLFMHVFSQEIAF